jgi:transposase, IS5 family
LGEPIPDDATTLNFRHMLEKPVLINAHLPRKGVLLMRGSIIDARSIVAQVDEVP